MRVLLFPFYSNAANLNGCSSLNWIKGFVRWVLKNNENVFFYLVFPKMEKGWNYVDNDDFLKNPRIKVIEVPLYPRGQRDSLVLASKEFFDLFNERVGDIAFDVILTDRISLVPMIKNLVGHFVKSKRVNVPVVAKDHFLLTQETAIGTPLDVEIQQSLGLAMADRMVYQSVLTYERALRMVNRYLQPSLVAKMIENSVLINFGVNCEIVDKYKTEERNHLRTILFSQRLEQNANWEFLFEVLDKVFRIGDGFQVVICTNNKNLKQLEKIKNQYPHFQLFAGLPQDKYLELVSKCHAFVLASRFEEYPTVAFEALRLGLVGIFPRREWVKRLMPKNYPLVFKDGMEAIVHIRRVLEMSDEELNKFRLDKWVTDEHNVEDGYWKVFHCMEDAIATKKPVRMSQQTIDMISESAKEIGDSFPASMIYDSMCRHSTNKVIVGADKGAYGITKFFVREVLFRAGYYDRGDTEYPVYVKRITKE